MEGRQFRCSVFRSLLYMRAPELRWNLGRKLPVAGVAAPPITLVEGLRSAGSSASSCGVALEFEQITASLQDTYVIGRNFRDFIVSVE